jgi:hypothetical protein
VTFALQRHFPRVNTGPISQDTCLVLNVLSTPFGPFYTTVRLRRECIGMNTAAAAAPEKVSTMASRPPFTERGALRLLIRRESFFSGLFGSLAAIATPGPPQRSTPIRYFTRGTVLPAAYRGRSASLSLVLHGLAVAALVYLPPLLPAAHVMSQSQRPEKIYYYYRIPLQQLPQALQAVSTAPRKKQASHHPVSTPPKLQSPPAIPAPPAHSLATLISKPAHPDNVHQTIYQSASPPDLIIRSDQKLPDVVILRQNHPSLAAPLLQSYSRPSTVQQQASTLEAPVVTETTGPAAPGVIAQIADNTPHLAIPVAGGGVPTKSSASSSEGPPSQAPDVVVVGIDPANATTPLSLPNGNRWGQFSIALPAQPASTPSGFAGKSGKDASAGASPDIYASTGMRGPINLPGTNSGSAGILAPALAMNLVFPVVQPALTARRNAMIISAGPIGGGGLNVYGALNCGKIYSIFLPMPGRSWSLQYCAQRSGRGKVNPNPQGAVIHLQNPLVPPDVDLQHRYDFKRVAIQGPDANRPIILKGVIAADGTVRQVVVYRGVSPVVDEAARIAFSRWRFKPAMLNGKPIAVEFLLGIPPTSGNDYINR